MKVLDRMFPVIVICTILMLSYLGARNEIVEYGESKFDIGVDVGTMLILNDIMVGKNISYSRVDEQGFTKDYEIELFAESPDVFAHEKDLTCMICHTYSTKYLQKGG